MIETGEGSMTESQVRVWEEPVEIPAYGVGEPDKDDPPTVARASLPEACASLAPWRSLISRMRSAGARWRTATWA